MAKKWYTERESQAAASRFGQLIGEAFAGAVYQFIHEYLQTSHPTYELLQPQAGKRLVRLAMFGGTSRQMDNVIAEAESDDPVAVFESKWLKDARHHNDKGAWILQLREIKRKYPTVRGAVANLAGYWTEGVRLMFQSEGGVRMVKVATDVDVYRTLQPFIDQFAHKQEIAPLFLDDIAAIRQSLPRPWDLANVLNVLNANGTLSTIAKTWLQFRDASGTTGGDLIQQAVGELLRPLEANVRVQQFEVSLQISSGNIIHRQFDDLEQAMEFMAAYHNNPQAILDVITPKRRAKDGDEDEEV